jgi:hypothetical protein
MSELFQVETDWLLDRGDRRDRLRFTREGSHFSAYSRDREPPSRFSGQILQGRGVTLIHSLEVSAGNDYCAVYAGKLTSDNIFQGKWHDSAGDRGSFELLTAQSAKQPPPDSPPRDRFNRPIFDLSADRPLSAEGSRSLDLPDLYVWEPAASPSRPHLSHLHYDKDTGFYQTAKTVDLLAELPPDESRDGFAESEVFEFAGQIVITLKPTHIDGEDPRRPYLWLGDRTLSRLWPFYFKAIGAVAVKDETLLLATDGGLLCVDDRLNTVGWLDLGSSAGDRHSPQQCQTSQQILIREGMAYFLDNVVEPAYIFRIDVGDPANLKVRSRDRIDGTDRQLSAQWLDFNADRWFVVQKYRTPYDSGTNVLGFPLLPSEEEWAIELTELDRDRWRESGDPRGIDPFALTSGDRPWALTTHTDGTIWLSRTDSTIEAGATISVRAAFLDIAQLGGNLEPRGAIAVVGETIFLALKQGESARLAVFSFTQNTPELLLVQNISSTQFSAIAIPQKITTFPFLTPNI